MEDLSKRVVDSNKAEPAKGAGIEVRKTVAFRAARTGDHLRETLKAWFEFYNGYDPLFTWWATQPYQKTAAAMEKYAHFTKSQFPTFGQLEAWAGADLMIKGLEMAGAHPTRAAVIKDLRGLKAYNANGLLPITINYSTIFGHDPAETCAWVMKAEKTGFSVVSSKPTCGTDLPGTSTAGSSS